MMNLPTLINEPEMTLKRLKKKKKKKVGYCLEVILVFKSLIDYLKPFEGLWGINIDCA